VRAADAAAVGLTGRYQWIGLASLSQPADWMEVHVGGVTTAARAVPGAQQESAQSSR
jgi:hypothetical protein